MATTTTSTTTIISTTAAMGWALVMALQALLPLEDRTRRAMMACHQHCSGHSLATPTAMVGW